MVIENITSIGPIDILIKDLSFTIKFFEAVGGFIIAFVLFNIINTIINRKRNKELQEVKELIRQIEANTRKRKN